MTEILKGINAGIAFLLELAMLAAFGYWGFYGDRGVLPKWLLGIGLPVLVAILWGIFLAPRSAFRLRTIPGNFLSSILFLLAALAVFYTGHTVLAIIFATIAVLNRVIILMWKQW